jgi:peptide/nickel transport system ATP-binding protein
MTAPPVAPLVEVENLRVRFAGTPPVHAVNDVSFRLAPGEVLGILGEAVRARA